MTLLGNIGIILLGIVALAVVVAGAVFLAMLVGLLSSKEDDNKPIL